MNILSFRVRLFRGKQLSGRYFLEFLVFGWWKIDGQRKYFLFGKSSHKIVENDFLFSKEEIIFPSLRTRSRVASFLMPSFSRNLGFLISSPPPSTPTISSGRASPHSTMLDLYPHEALGFWSRPPPPSTLMISSGGAFPHPTVLDLRDMPYFLFTPGRGLWPQASSSLAPGRRGSA